MRGVNAYDDLSAFQFRSGKGYEKRSVEQFRASALTAIDDLLRVNVQLQDRLAGPAALAAKPPSSALHPDEQHLVNQYRSMTTSQRSDLLRGLEYPSPRPASVDNPAQFNGSIEPQGWPEPVTAPPLSPPPSSPTPSISWDSPLSPPAPFTSPPSMYAQPDWLTEWESLSPDQGTGAATDEAISTRPMNEWLTPQATDTASSNSDFGWSRDDMAPPSWPSSSNESPFPAPATLPPFMPPPQPSNEVGVPLESEVLLPPRDHQFDESPLSQDHLDDLFNQLDFGPPSVDLLPHGGLNASDVSLHAAPLHVGLVPESDQPLPPPVRPWEGWIR